MKRANHALCSNKMKRIAGLSKAAVAFGRRVSTYGSAHGREKFLVLLELVFSPVRFPFLPLREIEGDCGNNHSRCSGDHGDNDRRIHCLP